MSRRYRPGGRGPIRRTRAPDAATADSDVGRVLHPGAGPRRYLMRCWGRCPEWTGFREIEMAKVQGEGDYESARRYNERTRNFMKKAGASATKRATGGVDAGALRK